MVYNKLVRDLIPEIVRAEGRICEVVVLPEAAYREALLAKLVEEAREVQAAREVQLVTELADVLEVLDALLAAHGIPRDVVLAEQERRRGERGGFAQKLYLVRAE